MTQDYRGGELKSDIVGYVVTVEFEVEFMGEDIELVLDIDTPPNKLEAQVPPDFLAIAKNGFKFEVGAVEEDGNTTFTEIQVGVE